jgi:hypothetical protein
MMQPHSKSCSHFWLFYTLVEQASLQCHFIALQSSITSMLLRNKSICNGDELHGNDH